MSTATPRDLEQLRALVALAVNEQTPHHEAAAAALQAARRIARFDLLSLEAIRTARAEADEMQGYVREERARGEGARGASGVMTRIEVTLLVMAETSQAYRFARLRMDFRTAGAPCVGWLKKKYINQTIWASPEVARTYSSAGRRVVEALIVPAEVAAAVREIVTGSAR